MTQFKLIFEKSCQIISKRPFFKKNLYITRFESIYFDSNKFELNWIMIYFDLPKFNSTRPIVIPILH